MYRGNKKSESIKMQSQTIGVLCSFLGRNTVHRCSGRKISQMLMLGNITAEEETQEGDDYKGGRDEQSNEVSKRKKEHLNIHKDNYA